MIVYMKRILSLQVPIVLSHYAAQREHSGLKYMRGVKLANHITRILKFCGANIHSVSKGKSGTGLESKDEEFMMVSHEECEPEAACPLPSEPQDSQNSSPVDPAHYHLVNEREPAKDPLGHKCGNAVRQKKQRTDGGADLQPEREMDCRNKASGVSSETYVMCSPSTEVTKTETQTLSSCVSERLEWPVKGNTERQSDEKGEEHSGKMTKDSSKGQEKTPSNVIEFIITDSMKGIQNSPWVYQYFGVVDAKTGSTWTGSVEEYCR